MSGLILAYKYSLRNREINATIAGVIWHGSPCSMRGAARALQGLKQYETQGITYERPRGAQGENEKPLFGAGA